MNMEINDIQEEFGSIEKIRFIKSNTKGGLICDKCRRPPSEDRYISTLIWRNEQKEICSECLKNQG